MRQRPYTFPLVAAAIGSAFLLLCVIEATRPVLAAENKSAAVPSCSCPQSRPQLWPRPKYAGIRPPVERPAPATASAGDETLTLQNIDRALTEVGDGATYLWQRKDGRLSGLVQPLASFKDAAGHVCRHIVVELMRDSVSHRIEGLACRLGNGRWQLEG